MNNLINILKSSRSLRLKVSAFTRRNCCNYNLNKNNGIIQVLSSKFKFYSTRDFSTTSKVLNIDISGSDIDGLEFADDLREFSENSEDSSVLLRNLLYPNSNDPNIIKINETKDVQEAIELFKKKNIDLNKDSLCQLILVMWDHVKVNEEEVKVEDVLEISCELEKFLDDMNIEELTSSLMYLNKLGINVKNEILQKITEKCLDVLENPEKNFPLTSLSRFTVTMNSIRGGLYSQLICVRAIPKTIEYLESCQDVEELRLITICLNSMHQVITKSLLTLYKNKVEEFLDNDKLNQTSVKSILKIINFLNFPHWSTQNTFLIRKLMLTLKESISQFESRELVVINRAFQSHLESAQLIPLVIERARQLMEVSPNIELLSSAVLYSLPNQRQKMIELTEKFIYSFNLNEHNSGSDLQTLFKILRLLKISDIKLCNTYWERVIEEIGMNQDTNGDKFYQIARYCHRYMHFNNNLGGTYRHREFEKCLTELLLDELQYGISSMLPSKFAKFASFIIAYGSSLKKHSIPEFIVDKICKMSEQFSVIDCLQLSRGIQILLEMRYRHFLPNELASQIVVIENVLNSCAQRHMTEENLSLSDINCIIRTYNNRKSSKATHLFQQLIEMYKSISTFQLSSRMIRDIVFNLNACNYRIDNILNCFYEYIMENSDHIGGDTVEKIIYCGFNLGYVPENDQVLEKCGEIVLRDFNYMNGLSIIQACLALTYYKSLKEDLINKVFSIDFIRRLEQEIQMCYSKATYPERVLNQVMQLNRAVCLDYPELNIPWFQQNYIEAQMTKLPAITTKFHRDVMDFILEIVPSEEMLKINHVTAYGYRIDFVLTLDGNKRFINPNIYENTLSPQNVSKIALVLLKLDSFCDNDVNFLKGTENLKMRHLEILGFKVIHIKIHEWNSMYLNIEGGKKNYLKHLLELS